jgi:hypothetical protein
MLNLKLYLPHQSHFWQLPLQLQLFPSVCPNLSLSELSANNSVSVLKTKNKYKFAEQIQ